MHDGRVLVIGLPESGKTTFLAALWGVVNSSDVPGALTLDRLEGDKTYLNDIRDLWADCKPFPRTFLDDERDVSMRLTDPASQRKGEIIFRDMSGESFTKQWEERVWSGAYQELALAAAGALIFVHPRSLKETTLIRDAAGIASMLRGPEAGAPPVERTKARLPGTPNYSATQVQLVEFIQFVMRARRGRPLRLAPVISAWDLARRADQCKPEEWLRKRLPLMWQFCEAHKETMPRRVFGVSAQGGDLKDAEKLRQQHSPVERIIVDDGERESHDITDPVRWALGV